jgi:hypothetical protein
MNASVFKTPGSFKTAAVGRMMVLKPDQATVVPHTPPAAGVALA